MSRNPTNAHPRQTVPRRVLSYISIFFVSAVGLITLAAYLDTWHYAFNSLPHFKVFYAILAIVAVAFCAVLRRWRWFVVAVVCVIVNLSGILPWYIPQGDADPNLRIIAVNVQTSNRQDAPLRAWLNECPADLILLQEMDRRWIDALAAVRSQFPHRFEDPKPEGGGIVLWSRLPLEDVQAGSLDVLKARSVQADIVVAEQRVHIIALHAWPPRIRETASGRDRQLLAAARVAHDQPLCVLIGDLNTTLWASGYRALERESGLVNARRGFGMLPTWPTQAWPLMIPLDHCLCSPEILATACELGPEFGSDHLPLYVALHVPRGLPFTKN